MRPPRLNNPHGESVSEIEFRGFDFHVPSIETARQRAADAGVADRVRFEAAMAKEYTGSDYDLVTFFDSLHDMGDPRGAAAHVRQSLKPTGTWLIVEPFAGDSLEENLNPIGRSYYSASTLICTPRLCRRKLAWRAVRRPAKRACAKLFSAAGSRDFAAQRKRHSI